jgi:hypothetical protein
MGVKAPISRPSRRAIEDLSLDLARLDDVLGQGLKAGFVAEAKAKPTHLADQPPLPMPNRRQSIRETYLVPRESGPAVLFVNPHG